MTVAMARKFSNKNKSSTQYNSENYNNDAGITVDPSRDFSKAAKHPYT
jgi:hypothetical protein